MERKPQRIPSIEINRQRSKSNLRNTMEDIIEKESEDRETNHIVESKGQKKQFGIAIESPRGEINQEKEFGPIKFTFDEN